MIIWLSWKRVFFRHSTFSGKSKYPPKRLVLSHSVKQSSAIFLPIVLFPISIYNIPKVCRTLCFFSFFNVFLQSLLYFTLICVHFDSTALFVSHLFFHPSFFKYFYWFFQQSSFDSSDWDYELMKKLLLYIFSIFLYCFIGPVIYFFSYTHTSSFLKMCLSIVFQLVNDLILIFL